MKRPARKAKRIDWRAKWHIAEAHRKFWEDAMAKQVAVTDDLRRQIRSFVDFKSDLMLLMASQWDAQCGTRLINTRAIATLLEKYQ
jgi:hypothetical protein